MQHTATLTRAVFEAPQTKSSQTDRFLQAFEEQRLILFPTILLSLLCFSGIVASFGTQGHLAEIILVLVPNVLTISFVIGVAPARWVLAAFAFNILMDILVLWI